MNNLQRVCSVCNKIITYKSKESFYNANKKGSPCHKCSVSLFNTFTKTGIKHTNETKRKMSLKQHGNYNGIKNHFYGKKHSLKSIIKMSESKSGEKNGFYGKTHTEEQKEKMRVAKLKKIRELGSLISYNINGCKFIDKLNKEKRWKLQHAMNGGEVEITGYLIDGYDKKNNIVFEYDEKRHYDICGNLKQKDIERQKRIIDKINPIMFIRYDERNKRLYDSITNKNIKFK